MQLVTVPPLVPVHVHVHGPEPVTLDAVPVLQRPDIGVVVTAVSLAVPHTPLVKDGDAAQDALEPLLIPWHTHDHGPAPLMTEAVPALQRLVVGALASVPPFDVPHTPFVAFNAVQLVLVPPFKPAQLHVHGPVPATDDVVPEAHKLMVGALVKSAPFDVPHPPLTAEAPITNAVCAPAK
jgi:hypothetical protein